MKNHEDQDLEQLKSDLEDYFKEIIPQDNVEIFYFKDKKFFLEIEECITFNFVAKLVLPVSYIFEPLIYFINNVVIRMMLIAMY